MTLRVPADVRALLEARMQTPSAAEASSSNEGDGTTRPKRKPEHPQKFDDGNGGDGASSQHAARKRARDQDEAVPTTFGAPHESMPPPPPRSARSTAPPLPAPTVSGVLVPAGTGTAPSVLAPLPARVSGGTGELSRGTNNYSLTPATVVGFGAAAQPVSPSSAQAPLPSSQTAPITHQAARPDAVDVPKAPTPTVPLVQPSAARPTAGTLDSFFMGKVSDGAGASKSSIPSGAAKTSPASSSVTKVVSGGESLRASSVAASAIASVGAGVDESADGSSASTAANSKRFATLRAQFTEALGDLKARLSEAERAHSASVAELEAERAARAAERRTVAASLANVLRRCAIERAAAVRKAISDDARRLGHYTVVRVGAQLFEEWEAGDDFYALASAFASLERRRKELDDARKEATKKRKKAARSASGIATASGKKAAKTAPTSATRAGADDDDGSTEGDGAGDDALDLAPFGLPSGAGGGVGGSARADIFMELESMQLEESYKVALRVLQAEEVVLSERRAALEAERATHVHEVKRVRAERESRYKGCPILGDGRYLLTELLGKGGFSEVWGAVDLFEGRDVAIKVHQLAEHWSEAKKANYVKHSLREYDIQQSLSHPNVVRLFNVIEMDPNSFATVLEHCRGTDLDRMLKATPCLAEREARSIIIQVLAALRYLNGGGDDGDSAAAVGTGGGGASAASPARRRIIHYDLKPANILFDEARNVKVTDFGLAKILDDGDGELSSLELTSQGAGTYWYLPPECFQPGSPRISNKVDVWSVGVIFYQMLYGKRPFGEGQTQEQIVQQGVIHGLLSGAREVAFPAAPKVTPEAKAFIKKCLAPKQEHRPDVLAICQDGYLRMTLPGSR